MPTNNAVGLSFDHQGHFYHDIGMHFGGPCWALATPVICRMTPPSRPLLLQASRCLPPQSPHIHKVSRMTLADIRPSCTVYGSRLMEISRQWPGPSGQDVSLSAFRERDPVVLAVRWPAWSAPLANRAVCVLYYVIESDHPCLKKPLWHGFTASHQILTRFRVGLPECGPNQAYLTTKHPSWAAVGCMAHSTAEEYGQHGR